MKFNSTRNDNLSASFEQALFSGLAPDGGLFIPCDFPRLPASFVTSKDISLHDIGINIMKNYITDIPADNLETIIGESLSFPIPLKRLEENYYLLEVFHGPTLAFKDVGARFMARALEFFAVSEQRKISIIVATSGDTGSAIASAFHNMPNIEVYILYPANKISRLQEQQITTFGGNIHALEVDGTFDDCQRLVKTALADHSLKSNKIITTANSINIARLLPQMIYHAWGLTQLRQHDIIEPPILSVPSGNLGNLTSALYTNLTGFPVQKFIAAVNINSVFAEYLHTLVFTPQPSKKSFANAMDVGNPSNFERLEKLYASHPEQMRREIVGYSIPDAEILSEIRQTYANTGIIIDPHTAVGVAAAKRNNIDSAPVIITATAHPAKFPEVIKHALDIDIPLPESLQRILNKPKQAEMISVEYADLREILLR